MTALVFGIVVAFAVAVFLAGWVVFTITRALVSGAVKVIMWLL